MTIINIGKLKRQKRSDRIIKKVCVSEIHNVDFTVVIDLLVQKTKEVVSFKKL